jgi:hypothetical protein
MMVQAGFLQVDSFGNVRHGGAMEALLPEDLRGGVKNIVSDHARSLPNGRFGKHTSDPGGSQDSA